MSLVHNQPTSELKQLVAKLGGSWSGNTAMCRCPAHKDRTPSLSIRQGDRGILVTCHAGCDSTIVLRELGRIAKLPTFHREDIKPAPKRSGKPHLAIWQSASPIENTLAERYVRETRNIWAALNDVRFHPRCPKGKGTDAVYLPALIVAMRNKGIIEAIQRIFLDPATAQYTEKITLGVSIGSAWTNGIPQATVGLCEGFETAGAYTSLTGIQAWSSMGAKRLHQLTLPPDVKTLILLCDADAEGRRARDKAYETYKRPGLEIETDWPPGRLNDWAQLVQKQTNKAPTGDEHQAIMIRTSEP
ncbi:MAG: toprim domain-containing protein [Sphingomonadales bacterium]|nr:toprim domain-containing protein [Sphingomonadales bacterium]